MLLQSLEYYRKPHGHLGEFLSLRGEIESWLRRYFVNSLSTLFTITCLICKKQNTLREKNCDFKDNQKFLGCI